MERHRSRRADRAPGRCRAGEGLCLAVRTSPAALKRAQNVTSMVVNLSPVLLLLGSFFKRKLEQNGEIYFSKPVKKDAFAAYLEPFIHKFVCLSIHGSIHAYYYCQSPSGAQTERRGGAGPVRGLLGGKDPTGRCV